MPIAIVCHGFMAFQATVSQYAAALAEMGYVTYTFDFCGGCAINGKSDGLTTEMSVLTEAKDLESVLDYAASRSYANPNHIVVMGCSQGGFVSALVAAKERYKIKKLILFYPAFCIPDDAHAGKMLFAKFDPNHLPEVIRCGPMKLGKRYVEDAMKIDPFQARKGYQNDVLIVHGANDTIVALHYSEKAYRLYQAAIPHGTVQMEIIPNGGHGFSKKSDKIAVERIRAFLA